MEDVPMPDGSLIKEALTTQMPFGKYKGTTIARLPVSYLEWFIRKGGFPQNKLGRQMQTIYEIKLNGLEYLLDAFK